MENWNEQTMLNLIAQNKMNPRGAAEWGDRARAERQQEQEQHDYNTFDRKAKKLAFAQEFERRKLDIEQAKAKRQVTQTAHSLLSAENYLNVFRQTRNPLDLQTAVQELSAGGNQEMAQLLPLVAQGDQRATMLFDAAKKKTLMQAMAMDAIDLPDSAKKTNTMIELEAAGLQPGTPEYKAAMQRKIDGGGQQTSDVRTFEYYKSLDPEARKEFMGVLRQQPGTPTAILNATLAASDAAMESRGRYSNYLDLASRYETTMKGAKTGVRLGMSEFLKQAMGSEDAVSLTRTEWNKVRFSDAIASLPPGPASDRDIANALKGYPGDNANPEAIASFLRGLAKMQKWQAEYNDFKADFLMSEGGGAGKLNAAWKQKAKELADAEDPYGLGY